VRLPYKASFRNAFNLQTKHKLPSQFETHSSSESAAFFFFSFFSFAAGFSLVYFSSSLPDSFSLLPFLG